MFAKEASNQVGEIEISTLNLTTVHTVVAFSEYMNFNKITKTWIQVSGKNFIWLFLKDQPLMILLTSTASRLKCKRYKYQKIKKIVLILQWQIIQILTNYVLMLILVWIRFSKLRKFPNEFITRPS